MLNAYKKMWKFIKEKYCHVYVHDMKVYGRLKVYLTHP